MLTSVKLKEGFAPAAALPPPPRCRRAFSISGCSTPGHFMSGCHVPGRIAGDSMPPPQRPVLRGCITPAGKSVTISRQAGSYQSLPLIHLTALQPEHTDLMSGKLTVREGKGAKGRVLWVGEDLLEELREWTGRRSKEVDAASTRCLLPTRKGTEVATSHLRRSVRRCTRKASIEEAGRAGPHALQHTFTTRFYRSAGNIRLTQKALGHSGLSTTMIYGHVADEEMEGAMKGL